MSPHPGSGPDINAGAWYLRAVGPRAWEVCEPTTGRPWAEVFVDPATGVPSGQGEEPACAAGIAAVRRFLDSDAQAN